MSTLTPPRLTPNIGPRYQVPDGLWEHLQPLIPEEPPQPKRGRSRMDDRQALNAIRR